MSRVFQYIIGVAFFAQTLVGGLDSAKADYKLLWLPTDKECPSQETQTEKYINAPLFHDLSSVADISRIPGLNTHDELRTSDVYKDKELRVFYELMGPFDPEKETIFFVPGGPGQDHTFIHTLKEKLFKRFDPDFLKTFNVLAMDHRGVGCSKPKFPGNEPSQSLYIRYAASDMDLIRKKLLGHEGKIHVWGGSYGTMLSQTYALLYPNSIKSLMLWGAFSSYKDFSRAKQKYEPFVVSSIPKVYELYPSIKDQHPELARLFIQWTAGPFYGYEGRAKVIPVMIEKINSLIADSKIDEARELLSSPQGVMPWMMRSVACGEIFDYQSHYDGEFEVFGNVFSYCDEYKDIRELFNYSDLIKQINVPTFLFSNFFDHVTPYESMIKMAQQIPDNYFYLDKDSGHGVDKPECFTELISGFFKGLNKNALDDIAYSKACLDPPKTQPDAEDDK